MAVGDAKNRGQWDLADWVGRCSGPIKTLASTNLVATQNLVALRHIAWAYTGYNKIWPLSPPLKFGDVIDP